MTQQRPLKVLVKSPFSIFTGYGNDGFSLVRALHRWGCDVYVQPTWTDVPIPRDLLPLFGKELRGPFDLLINHWDPGHLMVSREARQSARVAVAWTMWEFSGSPEGAIEPCKVHKQERPNEMGLPDCPDCKPVKHSGLYPHCENLDDKVDDDGTVHPTGVASRLQWFDMVLGYDSVSLAALEPYLRPGQYGGVLQGGYESADWPYIERDWHGEHFQFAAHGALGSRKAPWTLIEAFQKLKFEKGDAFAPARLAMHTNAPGALFPELNGPLGEHGIRIFVDNWDLPTLREFYGAAHCLVCPSRGEGKNLPALEFMTTGGVVAATNYAGHTQWLSSDWAYPLDYKLGPTFEDKPWAAQDAKVSVDHLADVMWHIYTHRDEARQKAMRAREVIPKMCDWEVVVEALFRRVRDEVPGPGPQVYDIAMGCHVEREELASGVLQR
jgi:glycosyltransferase involved in cell wall biosynthesis